MSTLHVHIRPQLHMNTRSIYHNGKGQRVHIITSEIRCFTVSEMTC